MPRSTNLVGPFVLHLSSGPPPPQSLFHDYEDARAAAVAVLQDRATWPGDIEIRVTAREFLMSRVGGSNDVVRDEAPVMVYRR